MTVQVQQLHRERPPAAYARAATYDPALDGDALIERWPRRSRFLFIVGAASLSWVLPAAVVYWLVAMHCPPERRLPRLSRVTKARLSAGLCDSRSANLVAFKP